MKRGHQDARILVASAVTGTATSYRRRRAPTGELGIRRRIAARIPAIAMSAMRQVSPDGPPGMAGPVAVEGGVTFGVAVAPSTDCENDVVDDVVADVSWAEDVVDDVVDEVTGSVVVLDDSTVVDVDSMDDELDSTVVEEDSTLEVLEDELVVVSDGQVAQFPLTVFATLVMSRLPRNPADGFVTQGLSVSPNTAHAKKSEVPDGLWSQAPR